MEPPGLSGLLLEEFSLCGVKEEILDHTLDLGKNCVPLDKLMKRQQAIQK